MAYEDLVAALSSRDSRLECPEDEELAVLWALAVTTDAGQKDGLTASQVATVVTQVGRHSMTRQAALGRLVHSAGQGSVHRKKRRNQPDVFTIMGPGEKRLGKAKSVVLVDPARALQEVRNLEDLFGELKGSVAICDPYLDSRSLDFIACIRNVTSIRVLTERVMGGDKLNRELKAVEKQTGTRVEVRLAPKGILHDRYIIHDGGMLVLGTSLNTFGLRQSFVSRVGHDVREATRLFYDEKWKSARPL